MELFSIRIRRTFQLVSTDYEEQSVNFQKITVQYGIHLIPEAVFLGWDGYAFPYLVFVHPVENISDNTCCRGDGHYDCCHQI